jgi:hypothetical protein
MRKATLLLGSGVVFTTLAFAENWSGKLLDASCYQAQKSASACALSSKTTSFALDVSGKIYNLDANGNSKAATALKNRADRSADPNKGQATAAVMATVTGSEKSGTITVENIDVQ